MGFWKTRAFLVRSSRSLFKSRQQKPKWKLSRQECQRFNGAIAKENGKLNFHWMVYWIDRRQWKLSGNSSHHGDAWRSGHKNKSSEKISIWTMMMLDASFVCWTEPGMDDRKTPPDSLQHESPKKCHKTKEKRPLHTKNFRCSLPSCWRWVREIWELSNGNPGRTAEHSSGAEIH